MKQTTLQFEKKVKQPLTLERLQAAIDLISKTNIFDSIEIFAL